MNPGYISLILMSVAAILFASGWKSAIVPGLRDRTLVMFMACWLLFSSLNVPVPGVTGVKINLVLIPIVYFTIKHFATRSSRLVGLHLSSIGLFLASLFYMLRHLAQADPMFFPYHSPAAAAVALGLVAVLLCRNEGDQLAVLSLGLLVGTGLYTYIHQKSVPAVWGGSSFQDQWWASVAAVRTASLCLESAWAVGHGWIRSWHTRGEREEDEREE
jgi:hypothetical protein